MTRIFIYFIFLLAFLERTVFDFGPNVELVTLAMLLASTYLSRNVSLKLVFILMAATDLIIGNTRIFLFTWTGFLIPIFLVSYLKAKSYKLTATVTTGLGVLSNLFFYIWSNLGVWLLDTWSMYPKTLPGLLHCYYMGLPFLRLQLASTLIFVPLGFFIIKKIVNWSLNIEHSRRYNT